MSLDLLTTNGSIIFIDLVWECSWCSTKLSNPIRSGASFGHLNIDLKQFESQMRLIHCIQDGNQIYRIGLSANIVLEKNTFRAFQLTARI